MKKVVHKILLSTSLLMIVAVQVNAYRPIEDEGAKGVYNKRTKTAWKEYSDLMKTTAGCRPAEAQIDLDINNVRARMIQAGTMWWDGVGNARYEVPKDSRKNSLFAGSCWVAGIDAENQLKVCAQMFRQNGEDYWPGPINNQTKDIDAASCLAWDKIWKINKVDITEFRELIGSGNIAAVQSNAKYDDIIKWPAYGNQDARGKNNISIYNDMLSGPKNYAEYVDVNGDSIYNWRDGDYPRILGDQYLWWIFNDVGNTKQNTSSAAIGMEIQTSSFAFSTRNALNDMTFINYRLINRGNLTLNNCYMATFTDADLGYGFDDFVGCDTTTIMRADSTREIAGLGILYNGTAVDGTGLVDHYGANPPMVGIDYFIGPRRDFVDPKTGRDTFELLQMQVFSYFNNVSAGPLRNPATGIEYYRYMTGYTASGEHFINNYQGAGIPAPGYGGTGPEVKFVFPGDPTKKNEWSECSAGNAVGDRRFIHSAGPFTLKPGVKNDMTIGAVWVANAGGCPTANFTKIREADKYAQDAFDRGFILPEGPEAPRMTIRELDRRLIITLTNDSSSNNFLEQYGTNLTDAKYRVKPDGSNQYRGPDSIYKFQGYRVFQLKNASVTLADIFDRTGEVNSDVAAEVFQCDIKDTISEIRNVEFVAKTQNGSDIYRYPVKVTGANAGLTHSFMLTDDQFAKGADKKLVNYRNYYFIALAYGYNNFIPFNPLKADETATVLYIESSHESGGRPLSIKTAMPNPANAEMGNVINSDYGSGVVVKRIEGTGNGGNDLQLDAASELEAVTTNWSTHPTYQEGKGPIDVRVVDPVKVPKGNWELYISGPQASGIDSLRGLKADSASWKLVLNGDNSTTIYNEQKLSVMNDQILSKYGLIVKVGQVKRPGDEPLNGNGYITSDITFADPKITWLSGVQDAEGPDHRNWIRSGEADIFIDPDCNYTDFLGRDNNQYYEKMFSNTAFTVGTWAPANLAYDVSESSCFFNVMPNGIGGPLNTPPPSANFYPGTRQLPSIDLVFTSDKSKWTRCVVVEMNSDDRLTEGNAKQFRLRRHRSWNGDVDGNGNPAYSSNSTDTGMSWFPGYAVNQETGERLNVFFAEDSWLKADNGADMIWNPTNSVMSAMQQELFGGRHYVYVTSQRYDSCRTIRTKMLDQLWQSNSNPYSPVAYVGLPTLYGNFKLLPLKDNLIPTETRLRFRVSRPYMKMITPNDGALKNNGNPLYTFNTDHLAMSTLQEEINPYYAEKKKLLDRMYVVPNPYYGSNGYEQNRLDTRVRIINLPKKATVNIYSLDGTLVRSLAKDNAAQSYLDWDIKNAKGLPIASGMYLVHINADGIGETVVKWFGMMRPVDITTY